MQPGLDAAERDRRPVRAAHEHRAEPVFYEHHGFEVVLEGQTPDDGPQAWMMVAAPGRSSCLYGLAAR